MKTNAELQKDVQDAIKWEPLLNAAEIGVIAKDGVVTLTGIVDNYSKKLEAENATKSVSGVRGIVEKIEVKYAGSAKKSDTDIINESLNALKGNWEIPVSKVKVTVENGWVTLEGEVPWNYQREEARRAVSRLMGVKGVTNNLKIKSDAHDMLEKESIDRALARNWSTDDDDIDVKVSGHDVKLSGVVHSMYQKDEAERIAWNAPGVWSVKNELEIEYD